MQQFSNIIVLFCNLPVPFFTENVTRILSIKCQMKRQKERIDKLMSTFIRDGLNTGLDFYIGTLLAKFSR